MFLRSDAIWLRSCLRSRNVQTYPEQGKYCRVINQHLIRLASGGSKTVENGGVGGFSPLLPIFDPASFLGYPTNSSVEACYRHTSFHLHEPRG